MIRRILTALLLLVSFAATAAAQQVPTPAQPAQASPAQAPVSPTDGVRPWVVIGGGYTSVLGDCPDCTQEPRYGNAGSFLTNIGVSLNSRADIGGELMWVPSKTVSGESVRTTYVMAVGQFRFWKNKGFFVKGGGGMAFVRNWVVDLSGATNTAPPFTSKALSVGIGAGWEWRLSPRFGVEIYGSQHVAALGDLRTSQVLVENVVGNFWSVGGAIVFR
jgi:hypothetical protein